MKASTLVAAMLVSGCVIVVTPTPPPLPARPAEIKIPKIPSLADHPVALTECVMAVDASALPSPPVEKLQELAPDPAKSVELAAILFDYIDALRQDGKQLREKLAQSKNQMRECFKPKVSPRELYWP